MRIQPRQELLAVWKAITKWSAGSKNWRWEGQSGRNSVSDAELLLCLLHPLRKVPGIRYDLPDATSRDVVQALSALGSEIDIPQRVVRLVNEYLDRYTDANGIPVFSGGTYFVGEEGGTRQPNPVQQQLDVVDSFAASVVLTIEVIGFLRGYRSQVQRPAFVKEIEMVEAAARRRLTAAMVGLQRSFALSVFKGDSREGRALCRMVSAHDGYSPATVAVIRNQLREVVAGLRELGTAEDRVGDLIDNPHLLFECGWSWGVVRDAPTIKTEEMGDFSRPGVAEPAPYLYFTVVAVDGIRDLFTGQATIQGLLNDEQQKLARALNFQWELARRYWSGIATLGDQQWPLEDIPWRTTDEDETDYYTLLVTSLVLQDAEERGATDVALTKIGEILAELASRSRIRRRALVNDPGLRLHEPGTRIALVGSELAGEDGPQLGWMLSDVATLVLGRTLLVAQRATGPRLRAQLLGLADDTWEHIARRRLTQGPAANLWDQPANVFPELASRKETPSWYFTARVVQCLGTAAGLIRGKPPLGQRLLDTAADLLVEAEHAFDEELMRGSGEGGPSLRDSLRRQEINLRRARNILPSRPGTAVSLLSEVLRELDKLAAARESEIGA